MLITAEHQKQMADNYFREFEFRTMNHRTGFIDGMNQAFDLVDKKLKEQNAPITHAKYNHEDIDFRGVDIRVVYDWDDEDGAELINVYLGKVKIDNLLSDDDDLEIVEIINEIQDQRKIDADEYRAEYLNER